MEKGELPLGWVERPTGDLFLTQTGSTPSKKRLEYYGNDVPLVKPPELIGGGVADAEDHLSSAGAAKARLLPRGSVMISCIGNLGKVGLASKTVAFNQQINAILPDFSLAMPQFIFFQVKGEHYKRSLEELSSATTIAIVNRGKFDTIPLRIAPLAEQQRIVEKIETLFAELDKGEEALREVQKLLARYRQSVLKAAVTGTLTADWRTANGPPKESGADLLARILKTRRETWQGRGKYKEPAEPDTAGLPELPEGWVWATMPMLGEFGRGKSKHRPRGDPKLYEGGKYPFLQTGRVRNSSGRISEYDKLYSDFGLAQSKLWPAGTVCITIAANIAESGILEIDACFPDSVVGLVPHEDIEGSYIELFIRTAKADLDRFAPATAQKNINLDTLNNVAVPLPPAEEQKEIADKVTTLVGASMVIERGLERELERSAALRQSILKDAFSGKLVPQDPSDEPAEKLLERIRAARTDKAKPKQKKTAA